ncbi:MAG: C39 family peptidase [Defluviitaleaceae bacterium]|nr:C39 family peptidase [Defluviitaleaceae bacterium]
MSEWIKHIGRILLLVGVVFLFSIIITGNVSDMPSAITPALAAVGASPFVPEPGFVRLSFTPPSPQGSGTTITPQPHNTAVPTHAPTEFNLQIPHVAQLVELIPYHPAAADIAHNTWRIPIRLLELAIHNNETIDFVASWLTYGRRGVIDPADIDVSADFIPGQVPHFLQWDARWGFTYYGTEYMAIAGCGPTSLSMVAVALTGNTAYNPRYVADFAMRNGFIEPNNMTRWTLMSVGSPHFGLAVREVMADANAIRNALGRGEYIIASMRSGIFTTVGHFIVITCVNDDGTVNVLDSNSLILSRAWPVSDILPEMRNIWAFRLAD